jgi:hypothetical protein
MNDRTSHVNLHNSIKLTYGLNLRLNEVTLEFGMQLSRFLEIISTEHVTITPYGVCQTIDIKLASSRYKNLVEIAEKIYFFAKDKNYTVEYANEII